MLTFTSDQWVIVALIFVLGLLVGAFMASGGGRKWKQRYNTELDRRRELEGTHATREKEWREQESLHAAALKDRGRDPVVTPRDPVVNRGPAIGSSRDSIPVVDRNNDGVIDDRDR
jgi:hypothetical protein